MRTIRRAGDGRLVGNRSTGERVTVLSLAVQKGGGGFMSEGIHCLLIVIPEAWDRVPSLLRRALLETARSRHFRRGEGTPEPL